MRHPILNKNFNVIDDNLLSENVFFKKCEGQESYPDPDTEHYPSGEILLEKA